MAEYRRSAMKLGNVTLMGDLFAPTLGLALLSAVVAFCYSKYSRKESNAEPHSSKDISEVTSAPVKPKKKKHKCGCGSKESGIEKPINEVKIIYGTVMGKSKVFTSSVLINIFLFIVLNS